MKLISLVASLIIAMVLFSCGAKEEKTEDLPTDNEIIDKTIDTTDYSAFSEITSDEFDEDINPADSSLKENMIYTDDIDEEQIDPPPVKKETVVKNDVPSVHQKRFYVVVGSFKKYDNAKNLNNYFKNKGYQPMILPQVNEYNRVAISSYVEEGNARKAIKKLRVEHNDLTFWLFKW